jgi:hypothetical protein
VYALCLASQTVQEPEFLLAAREAMETLFQEVRDRGDELSPTETRWLAQAMYEHGLLDPRKLDAYAGWLGRAARRRLAVQIRAEEAPYWDIVGGSGADYPPRSRRTAEDLIVMLTARALGARVEGLDAGIDRATEFLLRMQFTERNAYPYPDAPRRMGAFRERADRKLLDLAGVSAALEALALNMDLRERKTPTQ